MLYAMLEGGALKERLESVCRLLPRSFGVTNMMSLLADIYRQRDHNRKKKTDAPHQPPKSDAHLDENEEEKDQDHASESSAAGSHLQVSTF